MSTYWFKPKRIGYGATPCTWQGWLFSIAIILAALACGELAMRNAPTRIGELFSFGGAATFWFAILSAIVIVVGGSYISYRKTEGGWRWRS